MSSPNKPNFIKAYKRLIDSLNCVPDTKYIELIKYFFEIGQNYGQPPYNSTINAMTPLNLKNLVYDLAKEVVNLDMCFYVSKNVNPRLSEKFKQKMSELSV
jgi:hypothetical protein